jgi:hypothetical protein
LRLSGVDVLMIQEGRNVGQAVAVEHHVASVHEVLAGIHNVKAIAREVSELQGPGPPHQAALSIRLAPQGDVEEADV